jgi:hypothetical protein
MKKMGLIRAQKRVISVVNWLLLQETADFDRSYLHLIDGTAA